VGTGHFLAFGDSITAGTPGTPATAMSVIESPFAYPLQLAPLLRARYQLQNPVVDAEGIPSEQAQDGGIQRFLPLIRQRRPDVVILMEGTNDVLGFSVGVERGAAALRTMVQQAKQENVRVLLSTIIPQRAGGLRQPPRDPYVFWIPVMNDRIRAIATAENVPLVDMYAVFAQDMSLIGIDDVHPTAKGFQVMAETFFAAIRTNFEVAQPAAGLIR
jgi:lysophospholipase L1-like esterase